MIFCDKKNQLEIFDSMNDALREDGGPIYRTGVIEVLSGTRHILWEEDVDTCPYLDGWPAAQAASQPSRLGIGPPSNSHSDSYHLRGSFYDISFIYLGL